MLFLGYKIVVAMGIKNLSSVGCEKRLRFAQKNLVSLISEELNDDKRFICAIIFHISKLCKIIDYTKIRHL
jgi:hypothetical protein